MFDPIEEIIAEIKAGRMVIIADDEDRENEGDLIMAAEKVSPEAIRFIVRYTSGVICVPMEGVDLDRLELPLMTAQNTERMRTAYTVSVDAADGVTTGISAADRARTIQLLSNPNTQAARSRASRPCFSAALPRRRRAAPGRSHRSVGRSRAPRRSSPGRRPRGNRQ